MQKKRKAKGDDVIILELTAVSFVEDEYGDDERVEGTFVMHEPRPKKKSKKK